MARGGISLVELLDDDDDDGNSRELSRKTSTKSWKSFVVLNITLGSDGHRLH